MPVSPVAEHSVLPSSEQITGFRPEHQSTLPILETGHPILRQKADEIAVGDIGKPSFQQLIDDMLTTMYHANGIGLAAPQVGQSKRLFVLDLQDGHNGPYAVINPQLLEHEGQITSVEGCLSVPGKIGDVPRFERVVFSALDRNANPVRLEGTELFGRCLQHENDHLDGILYTDRAKNIRDPQTEYEHAALAEQNFPDTVIPLTARSQDNELMQLPDNIQRHEGRYVEAELYVGHCYAEHLGIALQRKPLNTIKSALRSFVLTAANERRRENEAFCPGYDCEQDAEPSSLLQKIQVLDERAGTANVEAIANGLDEIAKPEDVKTMLERLGGKADPTWSPHVTVQLYPEPSYTTYFS